MVRYRSLALTLTASLSRSFALTFPLPYCLYVPFSLLLSLSYFLSCSLSLSLADNSNRMPNDTGEFSTSSSIAYAFIIAQFAHKLIIIWRYKCSSLLTTHKHRLWNIFDPIIIRPRLSLLRDHKKKKRNEQIQAAVAIGVHPARSPSPSFPVHNLTFDFHAFLSKYVSPSPPLPFSHFNNIHIIYICPSKWSSAIMLRHGLRDRQYAHCPMRLFLSSHIFFFLTLPHFQCERRRLCAGQRRTKGNEDRNDYENLNRNNTSRNSQKTGKKRRNEWIRISPDDGDFRFSKVFSLSLLVFRSSVWISETITTGAYAWALLCVCLCVRYGRLIHLNDSY